MLCLAARAVGLPYHLRQIAAFLCLIETVLLSVAACGAPSAEEVVSNLGGSAPAIEVEVEDEEAAEAKAAPLPLLGVARANRSGRIQNSV